MIENRIKNDTEYIVNKVPILYKYITDEGSLSFAQDAKLLVSKPSRFNDPYDCLGDLIKLDTFPENLRKHKNFDEEKLRDHLRNQTLPKMLGNTGVSCFSETNKNMLMWSHYTKSHTGICVGFDLLKFYFTLDDFNDLEETDSSLIKINYTNEFKPVDLFSDYKTAIYNWLSTKSNCWKYEKEIRISFRNFPFPKDQNFKLIDFNKSALKRIFFGSKTSEENKKIIIDGLKSQGVNAEYFEMTRDPKTFNLLPVLYQN